VSVSVLYMSMSLDGYIAGPNDNRATPAATASTGCTSGSPLRIGSTVAGRQGPAGELFDEMNTYSAVLAGRRTAEQIDHWGGDRHGVPIFVVSHRPPGPRWRTIRW
jgi:dihydrofolate reductase